LSSRSAFGSRRSARPIVPRSACRYERFEVAFDVAESLRMKNLEHGVVIAIVPDPEAVPA
jgi:hypothetical protein